LNFDKKVAFLTFALGGPLARERGDCNLPSGLALALRRGESATCAMRVERRSARHKSLTAGAEFPHDGNAVSRDWAQFRAGILGVSRDLFQKLATGFH
jgi:hypothetical protein